MNLETINQIQLSRHLYELSLTNLKSKNDLYLFAGINLLQDSVETMLLAIAHYVNAKIELKTPFDKYFKLINEKLTGVLPFQPKLIQLNKIRVNSKHHGVQPPREQCTSLAIVVREFFDEACDNIFKVNFSSVSALSLIEEGETKDFLIEAKNHYESKDFLNCSICCRKAIYTQIEKDYDISPFKDGPNTKGLLGPFCNAPYYAKNEKYIEQNVKCPTHFIVYDHSALDQNLLTQSVDLNKFWNIWRLTASVYRNAEGVWFYENDFNKSSKENLQENIEYILNASIDVILSIHLNNKNFILLNGESYVVKLTKSNVPVYEKADNLSKVVAKTPDDLVSLGLGYGTSGLRNDKKYWYVMCFDPKNFFAGYIENDFVKHITKGFPEPFNNMIKKPSQ